jgi:L-arabinokinase
MPMTAPHPCSKTLCAMYTVPSSLAGELPDIAAFVELLNKLDSNPAPEARGFFGKGLELTAARAPGRLDVMGGIADYSGSLVLQLPIREATFAAAQKTSERNLKIVSLGGTQRAASFEMPLSDFESGGKPVEYEQARAYFQRDPQRHWAAYVAGVFLVLMRERGVAFGQGARILISSQVPEGKGVSSSAAIEVATMKAVAAAFDVKIDAREMALLCQKVENLVVGAPCGVMDQMTSCCGERGRLLALLCQPAELQAPVAIPDDIAFWGLDSGVRHSVSGADYGSVRIGAFMGYRIMLELTKGVAKDLRFRGYLANVTPHEFETEFKDALPDLISGKEFLEKYQGTTDPVTRVNPDKTYAVRVPTQHPIYEHDRVKNFRDLLKSSAALDERLPKLGKLMTQSHASYSACGLGSDGTDRLTRLVGRLGTQRGLFGAKITGGGSGGTVAVVGRRGADDAIQEVAELYAKQTGHHPYIFSGSSPGAFDFKVASTG